MPTLTGQMLGKVRVDMFLARGGMADVFIGTHTTLHRAVAIKFLKGDLLDEPELRQRFEREARVIALLRHPNIVQVYDFDKFENQPYLVMEYVPGASLGAFLKELHQKNQRLDILQVSKLLNKIANALKYAHDNDVIHRDIKPANILLTSRTHPISPGQPLPEDTEPIITDFGLVRFTHSNKQTSTGVITGTPAYMSPEQARGDHVDARTDVYSLGITIYEMLAGRVPFESDSTLSLLHRQIYDPPPPIQGISQELQVVMSRALAKNPEDRFSNPVEFAEAFEAALFGTAEASTLNQAGASHVTHHTIPTLSGQPTVPLSVRRLTIPFLVVGALVLLTGLFFVFRNSLVITPTEPPGGTAMQMGLTSPPGNATKSLGLLRFQDGTAQADQITLSTTTMPLPPVASQYEAWLITDDGEQRISLGVIKFDKAGKGTLSFVDSQGRNLIGIYHELEITVEPSPDNNPNPSNQVAYSMTLPDEGYMHVRHLLFEFDGNPNKTGFVRGLDADTKLLNDEASAMLTALDTKNEAEIRLQAEKMLNIVVGNQSSNYQDWNGDGKTDDPGDGFGLLLNGSNVGYIQGTHQHAELSANSKDATPNMKVHGGHVEICADNIAQWAGQLQTVLVNIEKTPAGGDFEPLVRQAAAMANQIRNGVDTNGNEAIEPIPGEGGVVTAYQHAYYMADISISP